MRQELREVLGKAAFESRKALDRRVVYPFEGTWQEATENVKELYRAEAEGTIKAYFEREEYKALRIEAIQTIYTLISAKDETKAQITSESMLHLGMFMAWSGGASEE